MVQYWALPPIIFAQVIWESAQWNPWAYIHIQSASRSDMTASGQKQLGDFTEACGWEERTRTAGILDKYVRQCIHFVTF